MFKYYKIISRSKYKKDMRDNIKPSMMRKPDMIDLHTGANNLQNNKIPSDIASEIIQLAKSIN